MTSSGSAGGLGGSLGSGGAGGSHGRNMVIAICASPHFHGETYETWDVTAGRSARLGAEIHGLPGSARANAVEIANLAPQNLAADGFGESLILTKGG